MAERSPLDTLKFATEKTMSKCGDQSAWDKWARRLILGIDNSIEAATKALNKNEAKFLVKYPPPVKSDYELMEEYPDLTAHGWAPTTTYTSSSSVSINISEPEDKDDRPTVQQLKNRFIARSACCRAVIAWGEWTMTKTNDPARDDLYNEVQVELSVVDGALTDL